MFRITKHRLIFTDIYKVFGISLLANLSPRKWEKYWSFIFPAMFVEVLLETVKDG